MTSTCVPLTTSSSSTLEVLAAGRLFPDSTAHALLRSGIRGGQQMAAAGGLRLT
jgi:hypothetical protein